MTILSDRARAHALAIIEKARHDALTRRATDDDATAPERIALWTNPPVVGQRHHVGMLATVHGHHSEDDITAARDRALLALAGEHPNRFRVLLAAELGGDDWPDGAA